MKKFFTLLSAVAISSTMNAQQIDNAGFENWETVIGGTEPVNWNAFKTADGPLQQYAQNQASSSTDIRPGSTGSKSVRIWSRVAFGIVANGNLTLGKIHMGSITVTAPSNYNRTVTDDGNFNQTLTQSPDSVVFWTKFNPSSGNNTDLARFRATLHGSWDCRDPYDAISTPYINASATADFPKTNGQWVRKSIPFDYSIGGANSHEYILVSISTNKTPGGGSDGDELFIDDVELIYNPLSISENALTQFSIAPNPAKETVTINLENNVEGTISIIDISGKTIIQNKINGLKNVISLNELNKGIYFVQVRNSNGKSSSEKLMIQ